MVVVNPFTQLHNPKMFKNKIYYMYNSSHKIKNYPSHS